MTLDATETKEGAAASRVGSNRGAANWEAEMLTGIPGAVKLYGRIVVGNRGAVQTGAQELFKCSLWGTALSVAPVAQEESGGFEMWECDVILVPKRRFSSVDAEGNTVHIARMRADQMLTGGFADRGEWGEEIKEGTEYER